MPIRPTFMGFESAKSSIFYNQKGLDIVGNNLANSDAPGYTRQRVNASATYLNSTQNRIAISSVGMAGQGVDTLGVSQMRDGFLDKCFREQYSTASKHAQSRNTLSDIQSALIDSGDITDESGMLGAMQKIFDAIQDYTSDPTTSTHANIVMSSFSNFTQILGQIDKNLTQVAEEQTFTLGTSVDRVNEILTRLTDINDKISKSSQSVLDPGNPYFKPNELMDQRNLLLDELSGYTDLKITEYNDGTCDVTIGGMKAVDTETGVTNHMRMQKNSDKTVSVKWLSSGENVKMEGGSMLAQQQYISGRGANIQSNTEAPERGVPYYRDCVNTLAQAMTQIANNTIPEADVDANGNDIPRVDADGNIVYKKLLGARVDGNTANGHIVTAGNIALSDEWTNGGAEYFIFSKTANIAEHAQRLLTEMTSADYRFSGFGESFTGTVEEYIINYSGKVGTDISYQSGRSETAAKIADTYLDRRDQISGVNESEETSDMIKFQRAFQAASRVMTTMDDFLDKIINSTGRVGL